MRLTDRQRFWGQVAVVFVNLAIWLQVIKWSIWLVLWAVG